MLQYLPMIVTGLQAMSALSAAKNVGKGVQQTPADIAQLQALANRERLIKAITDPNDVLLKNITAGEQQALNASTQQQLSNLLAANRKAQLLGRQTYFNPERKDESISKFLSDAATTNANTARSNALERIMEAAGGYTGQASGYGGIAPRQQAMQTTNRAIPSTLFGAGADALKGGGSMSNLFAMLGGGNNPWMNPDTGMYQ